MIALIVLLVIVCIIVFWVVGIYNGLVTLKLAAENCWSKIDVELKRRFDLIPNLIETVKGYAAHEKETLERVINARNQGLSATTPEAAAAADNALSGALKNLFALAESYPDLKANENFMQLQEELVGTENRISMVRQSYNDSVMSYNTKIQIFPDNIIAGMFSFTAKEFFKIEDASERVAPKVSFN